MLNLHPYVGIGKKKEVVKINLNKCKGNVLSVEINNNDNNLYPNMNPDMALKTIKEFINNKHNLEVFNKAVEKYLDELSLRTKKEE